MNLGTKDKIPQAFCVYHIDSKNWKGVVHYDDEGYSERHKLEGNPKLTLQIMEESHESYYPKENRRIKFY